VDRRELRTSLAGKGSGVRIPSAPPRSEAPHVVDEVAAIRAGPGSLLTDGRCLPAQTVGELLRVEVGVLLVVIGAVWTLQGANLLGASFMSGSRP
jgi:hypothetical protein